MIRAARLCALGGLALLGLAGAGLAQPATVPSPAAKAKVGDLPVPIPEIVEGVRECLRVTSPAARIDFRHLRDNGWKIGHRSFEASTDGKPESGNGDLIYVFGRGQTVLSTRLTPMQARCRIIARLENADQIKAVRNALVEGKVAQPFEQAPGHDLFKDMMRQRVPNGDFTNVLLTSSHALSLFNSSRADYPSVSIDVWAMPPVKAKAT